MLSVQLSVLVGLYLFVYILYQLRKNKLNDRSLTMIGEWLLVCLGVFVIPILGVVLATLTYLPDLVQLILAYTWTIATLFVLGCPTLIEIIILFFAKEKMYKGNIVEESLIHPEILKSFQVLKTEVTDDDDPWHLHTVMVDEGDFRKITKEIKDNRWYAHFWRDRDVVALFKDKQFRFNYDDKASWQPAIKYGLSIGIPREQLDFCLIGD